MKKLVTTVKSLILGGAVLMSSFASAQFTSFTPTGSYTFTQDVSYQAGRTPNFDVDDAMDAYEDWKRDFITSSGACGERRVIWDYFAGGRGATDKSESVSEGIAYGMLLAAYAGDKDLFDDLWAYYKKHRNGNGVMNWRIQNCSVRGQNGASDAELDVAMALIVASHQWQSDAYLSDAKDMIRIAREFEFDGAILKPGDAFGGQSLTNPSYFSPAYYRVFAEVDEDGAHATFWNNAVTKGYEIIAAAGGSNGLVPDWCDGNGNKVNGRTIEGININQTYEDGGQNFIYDAIRTPFRSGLDYLWHGDDALEGREYCNKITDWAYNNHSGTTYQLGSKYSTSGAKLNNDHSNTFVSCFSIAAMAAGGGSLSESQYASFLQSGYDDNGATQPGYGQYFNSTFKVLGFFVMSGHFYLPPPDACTSPDLGNDVSLCNNVTLNAGVSGRNYVWKRDGQVLIGQTSQSLSVSNAGVYEVVATDAQGCARRDAIEVFEGNIVADFVAVASAGGITITNTSTGGISDYSWTVKDDGGATVATSTEESPVFTGLTEGLYDVELAIDNSGFGCSGSDSETKKVAVGQGEGIAMDDFNGSYDKGVNIYTYGPGSNFAAFPRTYCSRQDELDGLAQNCDAHRCSYLDIECLGSTANWATAEFEFFGGGGFDLSSGAFVSIKMSATSPVTVDVRLGTPDGASTFLATPFKADVTTTEQVFTFDFTGVLTGDVDGTPKTISAWNEVTKLALRPYVADLNYTGTISVDYVIVGAKALGAPEFDTKLDEFGYTDFGNYLPDFYPNDPALAGCDPSDDTGLCYGSVPDWSREVLACSGTAQIEAKACLAEEVRWYQGNTLVATGKEVSLGAGAYTVELIGPGGVTTDEVVVETAEVVADFNVDRDNLEVRLNNNSRDYDTFSWDYDDAANDEPGSATWEIGYHNYATAGAGIYDITLTVTNTDCNVTESVTKSVEVSCDSPAEFTYEVSETTGLCEGDDITVEILSSEHAVWFGFFPPTDATVVDAPDGLSATITMGAQSGTLSIQADNGCSATNTEETVVLDNTANPNAAFDAVEVENLQVNFTADLGSADSYAWTFGDGQSGTGRSTSHTYATGNTYEVCLTVTNACASANECMDVTASIVGLSALDAAGNVNVYPTAVSSKLGIYLPGTAKVSVIDVLGNTIAEENITDEGSINVSGLETGMYLLNIEQGGEVITKRFVKE